MKTLAAVKWGWVEVVVLILSWYLQYHHIVFKCYSKYLQTVERVGGRGGGGIMSGIFKLLFQCHVAGLKTLALKIEIYFSFKLATEGYIK
jgi:hypothetical protein